MLDFIGKWKDKVTDYVDARVQMVKLEFIERTSQVLSFIVLAVIVTFLITPVLLFLGMGLAEVFADATGSRAGGYFIVAGIYLLVLILLFAFRKNITTGFADMFVGIMTQENDKDDDDDDEEDEKTTS